MDRAFLPYVSIRPSYLSLYSLPTERKIRTETQVKNEYNLIQHDPSGLISLKAEKRIKNAIDWLLEISPIRKFYARKYKKWYNFKINFVTLTLSSQQKHPDNVIKKELLNQFLIEAKKKWNVNNYLWRAEAQKNGNIHFHICTDNFIPHVELRNVWNRIQNKLGYVDRFHVKHKHRSPNSTDVHSIKRIGNISAYLSKYCCKNPILIPSIKPKNTKSSVLIKTDHYYYIKKNKLVPTTFRPIQGKLWGLSNQLSKIKSNIQMLWTDLAEEIDHIAEKFKDYVKVFDYTTVIYCKAIDWFKLEVPLLKNLHKNFINAARGSPELAPSTI